MIRMMEIPRAKNIIKIRMKIKFFICAIYGLKILAMIGASFFVGGRNLDKNISSFCDLTNFGEDGNPLLSSVVVRDNERVSFIWGLLNMS
jgi:hypothetical protein